MFATHPVDITWINHGQVVIETFTCLWFLFSASSVFTVSANSIKTKCGQIHNKWCCMSFLQRGVLKWEFRHVNVQFVDTKTCKWKSKLRQQSSACYARTRFPSAIDSPTTDIAGMFNQLLRLGRPDTGNKQKNIASCWGDCESEEWADTMIHPVLSSACVTQNVAYMNSMFEAKRTKECNYHLCAKHDARGSPLLYKCRTLQPVGARFTSV